MLGQARPIVVLCLDRLPTIGVGVISGDFHTTGCDTTHMQKHVS